jgi:uncharacterized protein
MIARLLVLALSLGAAFGWAFDFAALKPEGHVSDFSRVIDASSKAELEEYCARVARVTGAEIAVVTLATLEGEPVEDVANSLFRRWGIGKKEGESRDQGILLLLVTQDRRSRVEVGYGLEPIIPDGFAGSVLREMRPHLRESQFGPALIAGAHTIGSRIAEAKQVSLDSPPSRRTAPSPGQRVDIPWPLLIAGLFLLFAMGSGRRRGRRRGIYGSGGGFGDVLPAMLLGTLLGRSSGWGGGSRGGFGGYDSGDRFGGFGGGDSGGGGASSDW